MTIMHHPSDDRLAAFAAGSLGEGRSAVLATHLLTCPACRKAVLAFESLGGAGLQDAEPVPMKADALQRALEAVGSDARPQAAAARAKVSLDVPATLSSYGLGAWKWIGPGIYWRPVEIPREQGTHVFMLKAAPGTVLPHHKHTGAEWTCVLQGAFRHEHGLYGEGDFDEADEQIEHHPVVEDGADCICLVALQGQLQLQGWVGRLLQPFMRF